MRKGSAYGYVRKIMSNGDYYVGKMTDNNYDGIGTLFMNNGTTISG